MKIKILAGIFSMITIMNSCANNDNGSIAGNDLASGKEPATGMDSAAGKVNKLILAYLDIKNALANDDAKKAAAAGDNLKEIIENLNATGFTPGETKVFNDVKPEIAEHADHIGSNGNDIKHQRDHFDWLSYEMITLVKTTGVSQTIYIDFCPMYNNNKGAYWLSTTKEISNPYYGNDMLSCGKIKEEIISKDN